MKLAEFLQLQLDAVKQLGDTSKGSIKFEVSVDEEMNVGRGTNRVTFDIDVTPNGIVLRKWQYVLLMAITGGAVGLLLKVIQL
ncbi:hypothetical protein MPC38_06635 [Prescottella equi]|uniref:hypothetical protein n=1 Tax=Rhodococcus hoagii TaxID=43767 RepID=UPI001F5C09F4|nr:hypothetical protein [Prescottella equi]UNQ40921.1 hypothetical protein MPC38_06635 [Prescottella equi]